MIGSSLAPKTLMCRTGTSLGRTDPKSSPESGLKKSVRFCISNPLSGQYPSGFIKFNPANFPVLQTDFTDVSIVAFHRAPGHHRAVTRYLSQSRSKQKAKNSKNMKFQKKTNFTKLCSAFSKKSACTHYLEMIKILEIRISIQYPIGPVLVFWIRYPSEIRPVSTFTVR